MKKLFYLSAFLILSGILFLSSCTKDNTTADQPPTINFLVEQGYTYQDVVLPVNSPLQFKLHAESNTSSGSKLVTLRVTRIFNLTSYDTTYTISPAQTSVNFEFSTNANSGVGQEKFEFKVTDQAGQSATAGLIVTTTATGSDVQAYTDISIGSFNDLTTGSFFATTTGTVYKKDDATQNQAAIDFCFYLGAQNGSTIASPLDADAQTVFAITGWGIKNDTRFIFPTTLSASDFDNIGAVYAFPAFDDASSITAATHLNADNVVSFKTVLGKRGYIKIVSINAKGDHAVIDIKVEK